MDGRPRFLRPLTRQRLDSGGYEIPGVPIGMEQAIEFPSVRLVPLSRFLGDIPLTGPLTAVFQIGSPTYPLLQDMRGFRLLSVLGSVFVNINGGGFATVIDRDSWDFVKIWSLEIQLAAASSCIVQQWGE